MNLRVPAGHECLLGGGWWRSTPATLKDISFSGAYVNARTVPGEGRTVKLTVPGSGSAVIHATVVRRDPRGAALAFADYDGNAEHQLTEFIARHLSRKRDAAR